MGVKWKRRFLLPYRQICKKATIVLNKPLDLAWHPIRGFVRRGMIVVFIVQEWEKTELKWFFNN